MKPITIHFLFEDGANPFALGAQVDLYCYVDHIDRNPHSKVKLFPERAVLTVEGVVVPKVFTQAELDAILAAHLQGQRTARDDERIEQYRRAA
ncbi:MULTISPECIES: hypothetical protein [unclassified Achromobacter]|uniref:hypothetical protein n=1 Tax=unclassified Achromobacter TaxID=2626865 RepID=UPI000B51D9E5|nr:MULTISPECIES: hypothetical protein [unclassified Achromobacter]OWT69237.1 hypothetical protein CEY05_28875 [Achromobacter sp. HZ34]OWT70642.1 hypothetical protein CEY04_27705 [Achromobacter sp. HZ28]